MRNEVDRAYAMKLSNILAENKEIILNQQPENSIIALILIHIT